MLRFLMLCISVVAWTRVSHIKVMVMQMQQELIFAVFESILSSICRRDIKGILTMIKQTNT